MPVSATCPWPTPLARRSPTCPQAESRWPLAEDSRWRGGRCGSSSTVRGGGAGGGGRWAGCTGVFGSRGAGMGGAWRRRVPAPAARRLRWRQRGGYSNVVKGAHGAGRPGKPRNGQAWRAACKAVPRGCLTARRGGRATCRIVAWRMRKCVLRMPCFPFLKKCLNEVWTDA